MMSYDIFKLKCHNNQLLYEMRKIDIPNQSRENFIHISMKYVLEKEIIFLALYSTLSFQKFFSFHRFKSIRL